MMWQKWNENVFKEIKDQRKILIGKNLDVQSLSRVQLFVTHGQQHSRLPCP